MQGDQLASPRQGKGTLEIGDGDDEYPVSREHSKLHRVVTE